MLKPKEKSPVLISDPEKRVINFNAGPSTMPSSVLAEAQAQMLNYQGAGLSVMEMSHRSKEFIQIIQDTESLCRSVLSISSEYEVLFLQGGASLQFAMVPMNLSVEGQVASIIHTGSWTQKAISEIEKLSSIKIVASGESDQFLKLPFVSDISVDSASSFAYCCSNNTIFGTQFRAFPVTGEVPLVADMSSDIMSRCLDISQFGLIFAGAQKNIGPSGLTLVIVRKDLLSRCPDSVPTILQYRSHAKAQSLYHTPPTFAVYMAGLMFQWIQDQGGLSVVEKNNQLKAKLLYDVIDQDPFFYCPVESGSRSLMNVVFRIRDNDEELESLLVKEATVEGLIGLKGHRSVGGLRASIYNAQSLENIETLVQFMTNFSQKNR